MMSVEAKSSELERERGWKKALGSVYVSES
jgi:hypothetical protein